MAHDQFLRDRIGMRRHFSEGFGLRTRKKGRRVTRTDHLHRLRWRIIEHATRHYARLASAKLFVENRSGADLWMLSMLVTRRANPGLSSDP